MVNTDRESENFAVLGAGLLIAKILIDIIVINLATIRPLHWGKDKQILLRTVLLCITICSMYCIFIPVQKISDIHNKQILDNELLYSSKKSCQITVVEPRGTSDDNTDYKTSYRYLDLNPAGYFYSSCDNDHPNCYLPVGTNISCWLDESKFTDVIPVSCLSCSSRDWQTAIFWFVLASIPSVICCIEILCVTYKYDNICVSLRIFIKIDAGNTAFRKNVNENLEFLFIHNKELYYSFYKESFNSRVTCYAESFSYNLRETVRRIKMDMPIKNNNLDGKDIVELEEGVCLRSN